MKDENGNVTVDPLQPMIRRPKSGNGFTGRKVKGYDPLGILTGTAVQAVECRLYENIVDEEKGKSRMRRTEALESESTIPSRYLKECYVEPALAGG